MSCAHARKGSIWQDVHKFRRIRTQLVTLLVFVAVLEEGFKGIYVECTLVRVEPEGSTFTSICLEHKKDA